MGKRTPGVVIAVGNQKGGVGKTTTTVHLAAALGEQGFRCLIVDLDPAAGATKHLGVPVQSFAGSLELLTTGETVKTLAITDDLPKGVHLVPSRPQLSELDNLLSKFTDRTRILDTSLEMARDLYDFTFLDTPPSAGATTTVAAYSSAEWFLLSAFPHPLSVGGLNEAFKDIADVRQRRNPKLEVLGVVLTNVDSRTSLAYEVEELVARELPGRLFDTKIGQATAVPKASGRGKTLFQIDAYADHKVTHQYRALAAEVVHRATPSSRAPWTPPKKFPPTHDPDTLMAKPLTIPQPTSSIANLLESGVAAAALRPVPSGTPVDGHAGMRAIPHASPHVGRPVPTGEAANLKREFVLTPTADDTLTQLLTAFGRGTGSKLTNSHVLRAVLHAVRHAMPELEKQAARLGPLRRPSNARGNEAERDELEKKLAACLVAGMRACPLLEP